MDFEHYAELHVFMRMLCVQNNFAENFLTRKVAQHALWLKFALSSISLNKEISEFKNENLEHLTYERYVYLQGLSWIHFAWEWNFVSSLGSSLT